MWPIFVAMGLYCIAYLYDFPGGPKGFWIATKVWINSKKRPF